MERGIQMSFRCSVCGYIFEGEKLPENYVCPICHQTGKFEAYSGEEQEKWQAPEEKKCWICRMTVCLREKMILVGI